MDSKDLTNDGNDNENEQSEEKISKHKIKDKHKLQYDSIFKGKKTTEEEADTFFGIPRHESFEFDSSSNYYSEHKAPEDTARIKELDLELYDIIVDDLKLDIRCSRRKPSKEKFNEYMEYILNKMDMLKYSHSEVFTQFSFYFSDNVVNMYKLLNSKIGGRIAKEIEPRSRIKLDDIDFQ